MIVPSSPSSGVVPVAVLGGGPSGLIAAILLARQGVETVLIAPEAPADARTTALMQGSLGILAEAGVWPGLKEVAAPLRHLRMVDATRRLVRAPEVIFHAGELELDAFGWNIPNAALVAALRAKAESLPHLTMIGARASAVTPVEDRVTVDLADGSSVDARLLIAADGRHSLARTAAGIGSRTWSYDQVALALNLAHERPHDDTSTEFHTASGPFTLVPLPGRRSSLVAVLRPADAERLKGLDDGALGAELTLRSQHLLGRLTPGGPRGSFPLGGSVVRRFAGARVALIGEAAHVLPPIGAQGLNLGLRDAARIARYAGAAALAGADPGGASVATSYDRARKADVWPRTLAVDALNRSLLAGFLPADLARSLGLGLLAHAPVLRRFAMRAGIGAAFTRGREKGPLARDLP
jgi:2-octaprenyl-6-methoxyphenol hydroxylase